MSKRKMILGVLGETSLWALANTLCLGLPLGAIYLYGTMVAGWGPAKISLFMTLAAVLTGTWGSWATLVWTRNRALRALQQGITTVPGILLTVLGGALLYFGAGAWYLGALLCLSGVGMMAVAVTLAGGFFSKNDVPSLSQYVTGVLIYPLATTAASALLAGMWYGFVTSTGFADWRSLFSLATLMSTVMFATLTSTIIPAVMSRGCQELSAMFSQHR